MEQIYRMIFPIIASVVCKTPYIVEKIAEGGIHEILKRFDALSSKVELVITQITQIKQDHKQFADELFNRALQQALKKALIQVEVTGLYDDSPIKQAREDMFAPPLHSGNRKRGCSTNSKGPGF